jgi:hypothetical protein
VPNPVLEYRLWLLLWLLFVNKDDAISDDGTMKAVAVAVAVVGGRAELATTIDCVALDEAIMLLIIVAVERMLFLRDDVDVDVDFDDVVLRIADLPIRPATIVFGIRRLTVLLVVVVVVLEN